MTSLKGPRRIPIALGVSVFLIEIMRLFILLRLPDYQLVTHIPDDAFYYVVLAQHFAAHARWSFDGLASSTGFHLLWAYTLVVVYWLDPKISLHGLLTIGGTVGAIALSTAAFLTALVVRRYFSDRAMLGVAFVFLGASSLLQGIWLMESPLVILAAASYIYLVTCQYKPLLGADRMAAGLVGLLGMLARSDFGLLTLCMTCVYGLLFLRTKKLGTQFIAAASGLVGASVGLVLIVVHSYLISGHLTQSSAKEKLFWSQVEGFSSYRAMQVLFSFFYPLANAGASTLSWLHTSASALRFLLICLLGYSILKALSRKGELPAKALTAAAVSTAFAYTILYRFDSAAVQPWYAANYQIPVALATAAALNMVSGVIWRNVCAGFVIVWVSAGIIFSCRSTWPDQAGHYRAGIYLLGHPELQPIGAWNSGIIAYFSKQPVINLDGLVNDDVYQYAVANRLEEYIRQRRVQYLLDTQDMFSGRMPRRGGYEGGRLTRCLDGKNELLRNDTIDGLGPINTREALFHIDLGCLTAGDVEDRASVLNGYE
jgi:hypothetical protein